MKKFEEDIDALVPSLSTTTTARTRETGSLTAEQQARLMFLQSQGLLLDDVSQLHDFLQSQASNGFDDDEH